MRLPGFLAQLQHDLSKVPASIKDIVENKGGLPSEVLLRLVLKPEDHTAQVPFPPSNSVVHYYEDDKEDCSQLGQKSLDSGEVAFCILAGGAGTRFGTSKALLRIPKLGMSLLTLKLFQATGTGPIWIVVSHHNRKEIEDHLQAQVGIDLSRIRIVEQYSSYRLTPDNQLFVDEHGLPSLYPCGHGDVFSIFKNTTLLADFLAVGGKYVNIVNVDNVFASLDPAALGYHIKSNSAVTCEVVQRKDGEPGGVLAETAKGLQIVELFRLQCEDLSQYNWLNTNTFTMNASLDFTKLGTVWHRVQKQVDSKIVIQHERLLQEITDVYPTTYVGVTRSDRFLPIKTVNDLEMVDNIVNVDS